ncbi:tripartite tricarboxylate transporter TctB family protein [Halomonas sp. HK25]|uniref:tripartite tricarboxylate transporter TctB family protein n=1 Tax=Halomonas sp. HK25 TaxID=3394321 RepID=UPI0039FD6F60
MKFYLVKEEVLAALTILLLGVAVVYYGAAYSMGSLARMGPGYFPVIVGGVLCFVGVGLVVDAFTRNSVKVQLPLRAFFAVSSGVLAFAFLVEHAGLVIATFSLVMLSALGDRPIRIRNAIIISFVMSLIGVFVFVKALGVPISVFWW